MFGSTEPMSAFYKLRFCSFFFFFFPPRFGGMRLLFNKQCINSSRKCWLFPVNSASVHCSWTYKFYFSVTFSLKMSPTALFTHLKIILLQCFQFSVFNFNKISSIQTDPTCKQCMWPSPQSAKVEQRTTNSLAKSMFFYTETSDDDNNLVPLTGLLWKFGNLASICWSFYVTLTI